MGGRYLAPGLIDGHFHLESTYLHVDQFARAVVPRGTLAAVTDLHEVTNVAGLDGMKYIMECGRRIPMDLFFMAPSCVPATDMETSGATLGPDDIRRALRWKGVLGLGELMNFPGVIGGDEHVLDKVRAAHGGGPATATRHACAAKPSTRTCRRSSAPTTSPRSTKRGWRSCAAACG